MRRSGAVAVVLHATVFALAAWEIEDPAWRDETPGGAPLIALPTSLGVVPMAGSTTPVVAALEEPDPVDAPPSLEQGAGEVPGRDEVWDAFDRLVRGRGEGLIPELARAAEEPESAVFVEREDAEDEAADGDPSIFARAGALGLADLPEPDSLALDRLAGLEPELAPFSPSLWVLIRNPEEVENFLRGSHWMEPKAEGSVRVSIWIDEKGSVEWAEINQSSGRQDVDEFALALFNEVAEFRPAREQGVRVSMSVSFALSFPF